MADTPSPLGAGASTCDGHACFNDDKSVHSFSERFLLGIIYFAEHDGHGYVGQELQTERRKMNTPDKFNTPEKLRDHRKRKHERDAHHKDADGTPSPLCPAFGRAILKYGIESFRWDILHVFRATNEIDLRKIADDMERQEISKRNTLAPNGYNLTTGGQGGYAFSDETCRKISDKLKASFTDERRQEISQRNSAFTSEQKVEIVNRYNVGGVSASTLADEYGVSLTTMTSLLKDHGQFVWGQGGKYTLGSNHPQSKINEVIARAIYARKSPVTGAGRITAREFGVSPQTVSKIWKKQAWPHIHET